MTIVNKKSPLDMAGTDSLTLEFKNLRTRMKIEGYFDPDPRLARSQSLQALALITIAVGLAFSSSLWAALGACVVLALYYCLCAYIAHDVAHGQTSRSRQSIERAFLALSFFQGLSLQWWRKKHGIHHTHTNVYKIADGEPVPVDGDISTAPLFYWSPKLLRSDASQLAKAWIRVQAFALWPLMPILRFQWIWHSLIHGTGVERMLIAGHYAGVLALLSAASPWGFMGAVAVFGGANAIAGAILCSFFLFGHSGMLVRDQAESLDEFREQVRTTRNFSATRWATWLSGGLNYQIEHHLFPTLPRAKLAQVAPWIKAMAKKHGEPYATDSITQSYSRVFNSLKFPLMKNDV